MFVCTLSLSLSWFACLYVCLSLCLFFFVLFRFVFSLSVSIMRACHCIVDIALHCIIARAHYVAASFILVDYVEFANMVCAVLIIILRPFDLIYFTYLCGYFIFCSE